MKEEPTYEKSRRQKDNLSKDNNDGNGKDG
jgi:hypothetical protein